MRILRAIFLTTFCLLSTNLYADGVQRFNNNVNAAATTDWVNNWIAHVTAVPASNVAADSLDLLPFGMPLSRSPSYTATGSATDNVILSRQSALLSSSISNCLIADLDEKATRVRLGVEGTVLGILIDLDTAPVTQRFFQSELASSGCPTVQEKIIGSEFSKLYLATDNTLSAKNSGDSSFSVLNYDLEVTQALPATNITLKTYRQQNLESGATQSINDVTPSVSDGGNDSSNTFYADRIAFDNIGEFGEADSQFVVDDLAATSEPQDSEGLIATPGGGYGFSGPADGLSDKFDARPEVLLRVAGAPQDCNPGQISWAEGSIDGSGSHVFQITEETVKNDGSGSNGFVARQGDRWAARYILGGSSIPSGVGSTGEQALWQMNSEISRLGAGSPASEAVRRQKVKDMVLSWFDNRYIDYKTANGDSYIGTKYRYFKDNASSPIESAAATGTASEKSAFADTIVTEFDAWIASGNTGDLNNLALNLQTGLGSGSNARCGVQSKSSTIEVRDEDTLSERGRAYIDYLGEAQVIYDSWFQFDEGNGDAHVDVKVTWDIKDIFTEGTLITEAKKCVGSNKSAAACVSDIQSLVTKARLEATACSSSRYNYVSKDHVHYDNDQDDGNKWKNIVYDTWHREPAKTYLNPLGCYPWQANSTDADDSDLPENPRWYHPGQSTDYLSNVAPDQTNVTELGSNVDALFSTKTISGDLYHMGCPSNDNISNWPNFVSNAFPGSASAAPWTNGVAGFKSGVGTAAEQATIKSFLGRGFYRTKTKISNVVGGCEDAFASGEMVTYFYAPSSGNYNLTVDSVASNQVRTGSSNSGIEILNESGAPITIASDGGMKLKRGLHTLRLSFELSDTELAASVSRNQQIAVLLDGSEDPLPLFLSSRLAKASDPITVNGVELNTNSDQLWDGEYKPNVFVGLKPGITSASVSELRGMGGRFGVQSVHSAGTKLLVVSVDDGQKDNPRLRFDLVNSLSSTTADVGVSIDTVGVKTSGLAAANMIKVWQVQPSAAGGAYVLLSFKKGSLTFKGNQAWGQWVDNASSIGTKSKSVVSNDVGETFALLKIDPLLGADWITDPLRVSEADVSTATMTKPGSSNYASIALHVIAGADAVDVNLAGQEETIAANTGAHAQLWFNKELGWAAADTELTTLFGQPPYKVDSGVVGIPVGMDIATLDPLDASSAKISNEELEELVSLRAGMIFLPTSMPAGSTVENSLIIKEAAGNKFEIIPLRPGEFQLQFKRSANDPLDVLTLVVTSRMPSEDVAEERELMITHIVDAPPVDLDPSDVDDYVFLQMAYAQAPGVNDPADAAVYSDLTIFGKKFYHTQPQALTAESDPAQAVLVYKDGSEWIVRVTQSVRWNHSSVFDSSKRETAWVGEKMSYFNNYSGVRGDLNGYLVGTEGFRGKRSSVINLGIIDDAIYATSDMQNRERATSPLYPVADNSKFDADAQNNLPVDVVWYSNKLNAAWPDKAIRYDTRYPNTLEQGIKFSERKTGTAPTIYIGSQLGSENYSYAGQNEVDLKLTDLYFQSDLVQNLAIYRQPIRGLSGYNPNEEHALIAEAKGGGGKRKAVFALRNDLNVTEGFIPEDDDIENPARAYTSEPFVLVQYETRQKLSDGTYTEWFPAMRGYHVFADNVELGYDFQIAGTAGQVVAPPYPLDIILPSAQGPYVGEVGAQWFDNSSNVETGTIAPMKFAHGSGKNMAFWQDRNGEFWHAAATGKDDSNEYLESEKTKLNWAYPVLGTFDVPELEGGSDCLVSKHSVMLWCANALSEGEVRVTSTHLVDWPEDVAELWAGETVTFAGGFASAEDTTKSGLPGVLGMASLEVLYDSKNPNNIAFAPDDRKNKFSAAAVPVLSESVQSFALSEWPASLLPSTGNTKVDGANWLFTDLSPTFQDRFYYDTQRQKLVFSGRLAGKVLGDKTLTQAPIGAVLLESNVANQELVNQVWDLFVKHTADDLKQAVATLLRKSREPDYKSDTGNLIAENFLGTKADFEGAVLDNWLVGTRDISDTAAVAAAIQADVDLIFSETVGANKLVQIVDHGSSTELRKILEQKIDAGSGFDSLIKGYLSCTAPENFGLVSDEVNSLTNTAKTDIAKAARVAYLDELSRWLADDVSLVFYNGQLSNDAAYRTHLDQFDDLFKYISVVKQSINNKASKYTKSIYVSQPIAGYRAFSCALNDTPQFGETLKTQLLDKAKLLAWERSKAIEGLRASVRGTTSSSSSITASLNAYWGTPKTNSGQDKPQTPAVLGLFKTAVETAVRETFTSVGSGASLKDMIPSSVQIGKSLKWREAANAIKLSSVLIQTDEDNDFAGGVAGLEERIDAWKAGLTASSDTAKYVNRASLGPGIALVSNPEMLRGGDDWSEETYVSVVENNDPSVEGLPITIHVVKVNPGKFATPALVALQASNVFDEKVSLMVSNDFAGNISDLRFDWRWKEDTGSDTNRKHLPDAVPLQQCATGSAPITTTGWEKAIPFDNGNAPLGHHTLSITGNSYKALVDNLVYVRYRHKDTSEAELSSWSSWLGALNHNPCNDITAIKNYAPQIAIGWVKRVVTGLNPFESRMKEITGNSDAPASYVSMLQQAGQRYEGPIALNGFDKDVVESLGLIQAYETVLRRAKEMSIDRAESIYRESVGSAIQLVSNRLSQLYTLMGNEAFNDSLDGTIPNVDDSVVNLSSLHAFKNMVGSPIDEELSLLRGKEEIGASPTYNRLLWNYTKGEGEVAYNAAYFISDIDKSGLINEQDAGRLYPQGHGDAWGHYLHALDYYYTLMTHENYTWVAMGEGFTIADQTLTVDYNDEEQFARIAAEKAQVGATIADVTFRELYDPISSEGLAGYQDDKTDRAWGAVEWAQRATTGAYFDWLTVNSMTPSALPEDYNAIEDGVGIIARSAVPEIDTIASSVSGIASTLNALEAGSNPFGLSDSVVAYDLDVARYADGDGLFRQTWERANTAVKNAYTIFSAIASARSAQKEVAQTADEWLQEIEEKDRAYRDQLIEIFGKPYEGAIGSGKPYPEGYQGPDLQFYNYVDINEVSDVTLPQTNAANLKSNFSTEVTLTTMGDNRNSSSGTDKQSISSFIGATDLEGGVSATHSGFGLSDLKNAVNGITPTLTSYSALLEGKQPDGVSSIAAQAPSDWEKRIVKGSVQTLVHDALMAEADLRVALQKYNALVGDSVNMMQALQAEHGVEPKNLKVKNANLDQERSYDIAIKTLETVDLGLDLTKSVVGLVSDALDTTAETTEAIANTPVMKTSLGAAVAAIKGTKGAVDSTNAGLDIAQNTAAIVKHGVNWKYEHVQQDNALDAEFDDIKQEFDRERLAAVRSTAAEMNALLGDEPEARIFIFKAQESLSAALDAYRTELDRGLRLMEERGAYNRRIAARIQQLRYKDSTSRVALDALSSKYRRAFDMAARYVYMTARAYDYETNLKPENAMSGASQVANLSKQRLVGQYETQGSEFVPVVGYDGLAETLAILNRNYDVLVSRLGLSVTDTETNTFSLRKEMLNIGKEASNDDRWLDALSEKYRVDDIWTAPEASAWRTYARTFATRDSGAQPGLVIPFSTKIVSGKNYFGKDLKGGDSAYDPSSAVTRIESISVILEGYDTQNLSATPRIYLVPVGIDRMIYADSEDLEYTGWQVKEKVLPLVFETSTSKVEATNFNPYEDSQQGFTNAIKKFSTLRAYTSDAEASANGWKGSTRLAGRSVWNDQWLMVIPGELLLNDADTGLNRLIYGTPGASDSVALKDIKLLINSTAVSGN